MAVVIRMTRCGKNNRPFYRIVAADSRRSRDGRYLEQLGYFDPKGGNKLSLNKERFDRWVSTGAKPSPSVTRLIKTAQRASAAV